ncbi:MAG: inorganic phosphate transporter [Deltaproteobacteria bacterium]|nr:inorganic phosphate transporter [Deltaproteobacteria bacterium]
MSITALVYVTIGVALLFDIINGFHDAANSIATVVSTRVLSPRLAVIWATIFNFVALFVFQQGVANTISKIVTIQASDPAFVWVVISGLSGAIVWNLLTWWWGLPSSSSHALIGGLSGAGVAYGGFSLLNTAKLYPTLQWIILAPLLGLLLGGLIMYIIYWVFRGVRPNKVDRVFRIGQLFSAAAYSLGHGGNDAQKTVGVIWAVMVAGGVLPASAKGVPYWVIVASYSAMAFGTALGGQRIIKTMGMGITSLKPVGGFCANLAGAVTLFGATGLHVPVSTTHTITGAIVGVGSVTKLRGIRWGLATRIVWAWIFTIPAAGAVGATVLFIAHACGAY